MGKQHEKRPIDPDRRRDFHFYSKNKPRHSFLVQISARNFRPSADNPKVAWVQIPKVGLIKARGFNPKLRFGPNGCYSYAEAQQNGELADSLTIRVSKDQCNDYYVSVTFSEGKNKDRCLYLESPAAPERVPIGIDAGVHDIAALSTGRKIENKRFHKARQAALSRLNRKLSRRWGPANLAYRDYNKALRQANRTLPAEEQQPLAEPSNRYCKSRMNKARLERKITRRRNTYYHQQTAALVRESSLIAIETLRVKNMMRNHKLAHALSDAAMSDFLSKLVYKAERYQIPIYCIGMFEPSSQLCSQCGEQNPAVRHLGVRKWTCPHCGTAHDRDVNAARNILQIALSKGGTPDAPNDPPASAQSGPKRQPRPRIEFIPGHPELAAVFSKSLTRPNDPRYVIKNTVTGEILDDAQGAGFRSASNARNCYRQKLRRATA